MFHLWLLSGDATVLFQDDSQNKNKIKQYIAKLETVDKIIKLA